MVDSDEDLGRSRRPGAEDQGWSSTDRVLSGRTIGRSGDAGCGLYHTQGDEEHEFLVSLKTKVDKFLGLGLKTSSCGLVIWPQNYCDGFLIWAPKPSWRWFVGCATKLTGGGSAGHTSRSSGLLHR
jgi:hypothetical protein